MTARDAFHADCIEPMRRVADARLPNWKPADTKPAPVYLPDAISELCERCRSEGNDPDADNSVTQALFDQIQAQFERDEAVRDEMRTALLCAKNVLWLLSAEVERLGFRANYIPKLISDALTADEEGKPSEVKA